MTPLHKARPSILLAVAASTLFDGGISYPIWTDSRRQLDPIPGCSQGLAMEEVFTATIKKVP